MVKKTDIIFHDFIRGEGEGEIDSPGIKVTCLIPDLKCKGV